MTCEEQANALFEAAHQGSPCVLDDVFIPPHYCLITASVLSFTRKTLKEIVRGFSNPLDAIHREAVEMRSHYREGAASRTPPRVFLID